MALVLRDNLSSSLFGMVNVTPEWASNPSAFLETFSLQGRSKRRHLNHMRRMRRPRSPM